MPQNRKSWFWLLVLIPLLGLLLFLLLPHYLQEFKRALDKTDHHPSIAQPKSVLPLSKQSDGLNHLLSSTMNMPSYIPIKAWRMPTARSRATQTTECLLNGKVISEDGTPLPGATVSIHTSGPDASRLDFAWPAPVISAICNAIGQYAIHMANPLERAVVQIRKEGYATLADSQDITVPGMISKNYILQKAGACIEGRVVDGDSPIPGANTYVRFSQAPAMTAASHLALIGRAADDLGRFTLNDLAEGDAMVSAIAPGFLGRRREISLNIGPCTHLDIQLSPGKKISFMVEDKRGNALTTAFAAGISENVQTGTGEDGTTEFDMRPEGQADERGRIELTVPPEIDSFDCRIFAEGYQTAYITIDSKTPPREVVLQDTGSLSGIVLSNPSNNPVQGAEVDVFQTNGRSFSTTSTKTDAAGKFSVATELPDVDEVRVRKEGFEESRMTFDPDRAPHFVEVRMEVSDTGIFGNVRDAVGKPLTQFRLLLRDISIEGGQVHARDIKTEEGYFCITDVPPGTYDLDFMTATSNSIQQVQLQNVVLRSGYLYGEVNVQLQALVVLKKK